MPRIRPITRSASPADVSPEAIEEIVNVFRSILSLLQQANEVLGIPIPDKGA